MSGPSANLPGLWQDRRLRGYLGAINRRHGLIDTLALPNLRDLPPLRVEKLFVQPQVAQTMVSATSAPTSWPKGQGMLAALQATPRLVILGDPGAGKTTLSNWLAWRLSAGLTARLPEVLENRLVIPVVLRETDHGAFDPGTTIADLAVLVARRALAEKPGDKPSDELESALREWVAAKRYVLILDGLDEVPRTRRDAAARWMRQAADDGATALATSRVVGYEDGPVDKPVRARRWPSSIQGENQEDGAPESPSFAMATACEALAAHETDPASPPAKWAEIGYLMPFDQIRIAAFIENWYMQRCGTEAEAKQKSAELLLALDKSEVTQELARTPNLLNLMAIVFRERAYLPDGKALLFKEIVNAYVNTIDQQRKIALDDALAGYGMEAREQWLAFVGFQMQLLRTDAKGKGDAGVLVAEEQVLGWITQAMQQSNVKDAAANARIFLDWVARRSGLLLPRGEGMFAFVHLSFQEYFCARHLAGRIITPAFVRGGKTDQGLVSREGLRAWGDEPLWRECLLYLFELISGERDLDWLEDLADIVFGGMEETDDLAVIQAQLAARIVGDRHIHLDGGRKAALVLRCVEAAYVERWRRGSGQFLVLPLVIAAGHAALVGAFAGADLPTREMESLGKVRGDADLRLLMINEKKVADISALAGLTGLRYLYLGGTRVRELSPLAGLTGLQHLNLSGTQVRELSALAGLTGLRVLDLGGTQVRELSALAGLTGLRVLGLYDTEIQDASVLSGLKDLQIFDLKKKA